MRSSTAAATLDVARRASLIGVVASIVLLGHTETTSRAFYVVMLIGIICYLLARGTDIFASIYDYLTSKLVAWRWAFLIWAILSLLWTERGTLGVTRAFTLVQMQVVGFFFYDASRKLGLTRLILITVFVAAAAGALNAMMGANPVAGAERLQGFFGNPNTLAIIGVIALAIFCAGFVGGGRAWWTIGAYVGSAIILAAVIATASLKGFAGTLSVWILGSLYPGVRRRVWTLLGAAVVLMVALFAFVDVFRLYLNQLFFRIGAVAANIGMSVGVNESVVERARFIRKGLQLMAESPIVGHGLESFRWLSGELKYSHDNYIELGVSLGIIGVMLYYALPITILVSAVRARGRDPQVRRFIMIVVPTLLILDVAFVSYTEKIVGLLLLMLAGWVDRQADAAGTLGFQGERG